MAVGIYGVVGKTIPQVDTLNQLTLPGNIWRAHFCFDERPK